MSPKIKHVRKAWCAALAGTAILSVPLLSMADDDVVNGLRQCSTVEDGIERLACYDRLSGRQAPVQAATAPAAVAPVQAAVAPAQVSPVTAAKPTLDDLGAEQLPGGSEKDEKPEVRATVVGCKKDARKRHYFAFDNGQVWKQTSDKRLYFKDCQFDVTITQDFFGYKMQLDGEKGRIRISRVK